MEENTMKMKERRHIIILAAAILLMALGACSTTKRIPEGETLYTGLKGVDVTEPGVPEPVEEALHSAVDVATTKKTFWVLPLGLWAWNCYNPADSTGGLKKWIYNKFAKEPVLVSDVRPALRVQMLDKILDNNGFFRGHASYELVQPKGNDKKAGIRYTVNPGPAYNIDSLIFLPDTTALSAMIDSLAHKDPYLKPGVRFSMDSLSTARTRITESLRNRGYYFFRPEYIEYLADSTINRGNIALKMTLAANAPKFGLQRYKVGKVTMRVFRHEGDGYPDTIQLPGVELVKMMPSRLRPSVVTNNVLLHPGRYVSTFAVNNTQTRLSRLGIFNGINVEAIPDTAAATPTVDMLIDATYDMPLEVQLEVNASSKSNSYIGPGASVTVTNHNVFGGGEQLSVGLTGAYEWQTGHDARSVFNSYEFGLNSTLAFPRLLAPKFIPRRQRQLNWTRLNLGAELLNRPHYFKLAQFNVGIAYDWQSGRYAHNTLNLFKLSYNKLMKTTPDFDSIMVANPAVALSFQSQFVPQLSYTFSYDRNLDRDNYISWTTTLTEAGNVFWGIYELCGKKGEKTLFGTPFSQFVKGQTQIVWGHRLGVGDQWLVSRVAVGAEHAYGNSSQVPYSEQFYCGGANSVRAFTVRSIGPGSYHMPTKQGDYFDQTGTFKFEANVEYRFPIFGPLHGALFLDAGNVWLLKEDPMRPGGKLR
ncbi:MAG: BamA/TamA family outer membrane protein, partial [Clostridium sp.]|nr:BamA/TamA family outer membrane protein [Clostridium sp.]